MWEHEGLGDSRSHNNASLGVRFLWLEGLGFRVLGFRGLGVRVYGLRV